MLGKFKDELEGIPGREFVGFKPKMYSLDWGGEEKKVAKGINCAVIKKDLRHAMYRDCLLNKRSMNHTMYRIQSHKHQMSTVKINKVSLSPFDDKRYFLNERESYAYGHYKIK